MCVKRLLAKKTWSFSFLVILKRCKKAWQTSELKTPLHFLGLECFVNQGWYKFIVCMEECMADITNDFHGAVFIPRNQFSFSYPFALHRIIGTTWPYHCHCCGWHYYQTPSGIWKRNRNLLNANVVVIDIGSTSRSRTLLCVRRWNRLVQVVGRGSII